MPDHTSISASAAQEGEGVVFAARDHAGPLRRILILLIDLAFVYVCGICVFVVFSDRIDLHGVIRNLWLLFAVLYFTLLKSTSLGSLGLVLVGCRIITLKGKRPSFLRMMLRLSLWIWGPFNPLFDLIWLCGDERRQSIRDRLMRTYVVRKSAKPIGRGKLRWAQLFYWGMNLGFQEVQPRTVQPAA
jgi:hypothetical protein